MEANISRTDALSLLQKYNKEPFHIYHGLTGLIGAAIRMRPSQSAKDFEVKSLKKKFKDRRFAAGCSRDVIKFGAELLGWDLDRLFEQTILAMRSCENDVKNEINELGLKL